MANVQYVEYLVIVLQAPLFLIKPGLHVCQQRNDLVINPYNIEHNSLC